MNGLDLFSGIGGLTLALAPWVRPVAYCESDRFAQSVLLSRMARGDLPVAPIWGDVRTLRGESIGGRPVDIIYGGFPCQDISVAGNAVGLGGKRSGLFYEVVRLARECGPEFLFLENVPALTVRGLDRVLLALHAVGYDARWTIVSAAEVGAPHLRERIWIAAHASSSRVRFEQQRHEGRGNGVRDQGQAELVDDGAQGSLAHPTGIRCGQGPHGRIIADDADMAHADSERRKERRKERRGDGTASEEDASVKCPSETMAHSSRGGQSVRGGAQREGRYPLWSGLQAEGWVREHSWATEPDVGRVAHGVPLRVDRLRGLGNSVVPAAAREAFKRLMGLK